MKVVTGEKDADATDSMAFDDLDFDKPVTAPAEPGQASSPGPPFPTTAETDTAPARRAEADVGQTVTIKDNKVIILDPERPDWSMVAKTFEAFIPVCKTIADIEGTEVRYRALSRRGRRTR